MLILLKTQPRLTAHTLVHKIVTAVHRGATYGGQTRGVPDHSIEVPIHPTPFVNWHFCNFFETNI